MQAAARLALHARQRLPVPAVPGPWGACRSSTTPARPSDDQRRVAAARPHGRPTGKTIDGATTIRTQPGRKRNSRRDARSGSRAARRPTRSSTRSSPAAVRLRRAALRHRQPQRRQRRVDRLPAGVTHVFCFAYYVKPPPTSGTIVIRKEVGAGAPAETFHFDGNLSYNPGGHFNLAAGGQPRRKPSSAARRPAAHPPWRVTEEHTLDWRLADLTCASRDGTSTSPPRSPTPRRRSTSAPTTSSPAPTPTNTRRRRRA